jgi:hypothetical protein
MKQRLLLVLPVLVLILSGCQTTSPYAVKNLLKFSSDDNEQHCNLDPDPDSMKGIKRTHYKGAVTKNPINDADWYLAETWGIRFRDIGSRMTDYEHGKSLGVCIHKKGKGFYYTAVPATAWGEKRSWTNITYIIGHRGWVYSPYADHVDFPACIGDIKKLQLIYDYSSKTEGFSNKNLTLWIKKFRGGRPFVEVMLKFEDSPSSRGMRESLPDLKTDNYKFSVTTNKGYKEERKKEGLGYFFSVNAVMEGAWFRKNGFRLDLNLRQVLDYLIDQKLISSHDILPGIDVTSEIWDGRGDVKINELKYDLSKTNYC